jgi:hypothetical protein
MTQRIEEMSVAELRSEVYDLRETVKALADAVDALSEVDAGAGKGGGPPDHVRAAREKTFEAREKATVTRGIEPPWERDGYEDKQAWLESKRGGD